jgi:hypothetical protein
VDDPARFTGLAMDPDDERRRGGGPDGVGWCDEGVELRGVEPLTPSMRTRCATGLRHSPFERK